EQLFVAIANVLRPVFSFDALIVNLDGPGPDQMTPYFIIPRVAIASLKRSRSALERVFLTGQPIYVRSRADVVDRPGTLEAMERFGAHSYIGLPLTVRGKVIAALLLQANRPNAYDDVDLPFATEVASAIAVALDNCLAYERIAQSRASLEVE